VAPTLLPENSPDPRLNSAPEKRLKVVERSAIVPFSAAQMYSLVNDVARYPEFLPWCIGAEVKQIAADERVASLRVARGVLKTHFTTRNRLKPDAEIVMNLIDGPFSNLTGHWRFEPIAERGSRVAFRVEFEFKNPLTAAAFNAVFETLCGSIVDAFVTRARKIYG
jgi:ribosome-associated toxin RatA of RatAB toxin-antitoxin module